MYVIKLKTIAVYGVILALIIFVSASVLYNAENIDADNKDNEININAVSVSNDKEEMNYTDKGKSKLIVLMYHSLCDDGEKQNKFVISKSELEKDLKYITENGYTTVGVSDLINFSEGDESLPDKPVLLTFDDGYYNNYCYGYPLFKKYNVKAVISIIGKYTDLYSEEEEENPLYSHITWEQAKEMKESGLIDIENHSYDSHTITKKRNGTKKNTGESKSTYAEYIYSDIGKLQSEIKEKLGYTPRLFAYPFGSVSNESFEILKDMGFKITLSCEEKINFIDKGNKDALFMLGRYLRSNNKSAEQILTSAK